MTKKQAVEKILKREDPGRFIYAPNYWQWFTHQQNHNSLDTDIAYCRSQLDCINHLGLDVFSRNVYSSPYDYWFGGLSDRVFDGVSIQKTVEKSGEDTLTILRYTTPSGVLEERLRYILSESTLVQDKYLLDDPMNQLDAFEQLMNSMSYRYIPGSYNKVAGSVGENGHPVAGEFFSPLKMLHIFLGPVAATYLLMDEPERMKRVMAVHEERQLALLGEMLNHGVPTVMSMDNLDSMFHPPHFVEEYSASFYEKASTMCHERNANFFIHACGQQRANLKLISSLGVDGLEGVAYPPLGDVELEEAMELAGNGFIITGGISAAETTTLKTQDEVYRYVDDLFQRMKPYRNRFMLSASCNTAIETSWETLLQFQSAWKDLGL